MTQTAENVSRMKTISQYKTPPGPRGHILFGSALDLQRDPLGVFSTLASQYGDIVRTRMFFQPTYVFYHPEYVQQVLQGNNRNYDRNNSSYDVIRLFMGNGLVTNNDAASWLRQRRLMQPAFHRKRIAAFGTLMTDATVTMLQQWQDDEKHDRCLNVAEEMFRLTLQIVGEALFGVNLSEEVKRVNRAFVTLGKLLTDYLFFPFPPLFVPTPRNRHIRAAVRTLDEVVYALITQRRKQSTDTGDLLSMLLLARDEETGQGMSDQQLHDEVLTLMFAGHETTANTLTWTWYLLSQHPEVESRLHAEVESVLKGRPPTVEDLPHLSYTRMIIDEALRLYPSAAFIIKHAVAEDDIGGYHIAANSLVIVSPYVTHRHPTFWEQPEVFDPERFTPERTMGRPRYAYFPFGGGPHLCIGNNFALMEAQLILATIGQRYRLRLMPGHRVEPKVVVTLQPKGGLPMTLQKRA